MKEEIVKDLIARLMDRRLPKVSAVGSGNFQEKLDKIKARYQEIKDEVARTLNR